MPLTGEEGELAEDGPNSGRGADNASIGPTLYHHVVDNCTDVGYRGKSWGQKMELGHKGGHLQIVVCTVSVGLKLGDQVALCLERKWGTTHKPLAFCIFTD